MRPIVIIGNGGFGREVLELLKDCIADGSTWEIHENNAVDLASHVNQTVDLRGVVSNEKAHNMKEDAKDMASDSGATKPKAEHGHLKATKIHKVSDSCQ